MLILCKKQIRFPLPFMFKILSTSEISAVQLGINLLPRQLGKAYRLYVSRLTYIEGNIISMSKDSDSDKPNMAKIACNT